MGIASAQPKKLVTALTIFGIREKQNTVFCEVSLGKNNSAPHTYRCTHHSIGRPTLKGVERFSERVGPRIILLESVKNFEKIEYLRY